MGVADSSKHLVTWMKLQASQAKNECRRVTPWVNVTDKGSRGFFKRLFDEEDDM